MGDVSDRTRRIDELPTMTSMSFRTRRKIGSWRWGRRLEEWSSARSAAPSRANPVQSLSR
jgi:hypothetical protein